jgi:hypothetical protein
MLVVWMLVGCWLVRLYVLNGSIGRAAFTRDINALHGETVQNAIMSNYRLSMTKSWDTCFGIHVLGYMFWNASFWNTFLWDTPPDFRLSCLNALP